MKASGSEIRDHERNKLCVGSTDRKSDRERLKKRNHDNYRGCKMLADRLHRARTDSTHLSLHRGVYSECEMSHLQYISA